jgi:hypothetical protein
MPPYAMPGQKLQSGLVSSSGGTQNYHEIRLDDTAGKEVMLLHSERDLVHESENNHTISVGNSQGFQVANSHQVHAGHSMLFKVGGGSGSGGGSEDAGSDSSDSTTAFSDQAIDGWLTVQTPNYLTMTYGANNLLVGGVYATTVVGGMNTTVFVLNTAFNFGLVFNINAAYTMVLQTGKTKVNGGPLTDVNGGPVFATLPELTALRGEVSKIDGGVYKMQGSLNTLQGKVNRVQGVVSKEIDMVYNVVSTRIDQLVEKNETIANRISEIADEQSVIANQTSEIASQVHVIGEASKTYATKEEVAATVNNVRGELSEVAASADMGVAAYTQLGEMFQL